MEEKFKGSSNSAIIYLASSNMIGLEGIGILAEFFDAPYSTYVGWFVFILMFFSILLFGKLFFPKHLKNLKDAAKKDSTLKDGFKVTLDRELSLGKFSLYAGILWFALIFSFLVATGLNNKMLEECSSGNKNFLACVY